MNMRKITSMILVWTLVVLFINSIVLYVVPEGRVSYWADWSFLGLTKSDWGAQHITIGVLFLFAGLLHIYYNWKPILNYMKNKAKDFKFFSGANTVALILTLFFVVGTYFHVPPMSTIVNISEGFKDRAADKYGVPPYGHAESSPLKTFAKRVGIDLTESMEQLKAAGLEVQGEEDTLKEIAHKAGKSPQEIYLLIKPTAKPTKSSGAAGLQKESGSAAIEAFINAERSGLGRLTIADICTTYGLDSDELLAGLSAKGMNTSVDTKLREIADTYGSTPLDIYELLVEIVSGK